MTIDKYKAPHFHLLQAHQVDTVDHNKSLNLEEGLFQLADKQIPAGDLQVLHNHSHQLSMKHYAYHPKRKLYQKGLNLQLHYQL